MARKSFEREMRAWKRRSDEARAREFRGGLLRVSHAARVVANSMRDAMVPRMQAVSASLEQHGLVITSRRDTRTRNDSAGRQRKRRED